MLTKHAVSSFDDLINHTKSREHNAPGSIHTFSTLDTKQISNYNVNI